MITKFIKSIFGGSSEDGAGVTVNATASADGMTFTAQAVAVPENEELEKFVEYIVRGLVDNPEDVSIVSEDAENDARMLRIHCAKEDVGKVVGKRGKTIIALRSLINGAAGRMQKRILVEVAD